MCPLNAFLAAFERDRARAFVAFGEAAVDERHGERMLPCRRREGNSAQPVVDGFDGRIERLVDRLVIGFTTDVRAVELFAVEQHDDGVLELHARHFARERHVADRELVFAVGRKVVRDDEAAARAERQAGQMVLLPPRAGSAVRRQRDDHVGGVAVGGCDRQRLRIADGFERDRARGVDVLTDESRRHLQSVTVVVVVAADVVLRQENGRVDLEREEVSHGVRVLAAVQAPHGHAPRYRLIGRSIDFVGEPQGEVLDGLAVGP
jgi:hypothetical protein